MATATALLLMMNQKGFAQINACGCHLIFISSRNQEVISAGLFLLNGALAGRDKFRLGAGSPIAPIPRLANESTGLLQVASDEQ